YHPFIQEDIPAIFSNQSYQTTRRNFYDTFADSDTFFESNTSLSSSSSLDAVYTIPTVSPVILSIVFGISIKIYIPAIHATISIGNPIISRRTADIIIPPPGIPATPAAIMTPRTIICKNSNGLNEIP